MRTRASEILKIRQKSHSEPEVLWFLELQRKPIWFAEEKKETKIALEVLILIYKVT
jgi:hypothetical protein